VAVCFLSKHKALGSVPITKKTKKLTKGKSIWGLAIELRGRTLAEHMHSLRYFAKQSKTKQNKTSAGILTPEHFVN
jgi:hypothetical protein